MAVRHWASIALSLVLAQGLCAQETNITLTAKSGTMTLSGALLDFDGTHIALDSAYGPIVLDSSKFTCTGDACPQTTPRDEDLVIAAPAGLIDVLLPALVENFALRRAKTVTTTTTAKTVTMSLSTSATPKRHLNITFLTTEEAAPIDAMINRDATIAIAFRGLSRDEKDRLASKNPVALTDSQSITLALDAIVPVVAPPNDRSDIDLADLLDRLTTADQAITVSSKARRYFETLDQPVAQDTPLEHLVETLYGQSAKIGAVPYSTLSGLQVLNISGSCGTMPTLTRRHIKTGDYPLAVPMFLHIAPYHIGPQAREFLEYATSAAAQMVVQRAGFVDQTIDEIPISAQGDRMAHAIETLEPDTLGHLQNFVQHTTDAARLTVTFRFDAGGTQLDDMSRAQIDRLVTLIETGRFTGRALKFIGFSDAEGTFDANLALSQNRASTVLQMVLDRLDPQKADVASMASTGFGPVLPMACEDTEIGKRINRRVEVWVQ